MMQAQKRRLGRGLAALIGDDVIEAASPEESRGLRHLPIELLQIGRASCRERVYSSV